MGIKGGSPGGISLGNISPNSCKSSWTFRGKVSNAGIVAMLRDVSLDRRR